MELDTKFTHSGAVLTYTVSGEMDLDELVTHIEDRYDDPQIHGVKLFLLDLDHVEATTVTTDSIKRFIETTNVLRHQHDDERPIVYVSGDPLVFGMTRMRQSLDPEPGNVTTSLFRTMDEANRWIQDYLSSLPD